MSGKGLWKFAVLHPQLIDKNDIFPLVYRKKPQGSFAGWRLNKAQRDFINGWYEVGNEKE